MLNDAAIWKNLTSPRRLFLIAGPCVIESEKLCLQVAASLKKTCAVLGIFYVFKASFDKANRTSEAKYTFVLMPDGSMSGQLDTTNTRGHFNFSIVLDRIE